MEITKALCETILNTLPIGYYAGRRINITLDEEAPTSFYSPIEDSIVVSYPIIAERMNKASASVNPESAVRAMLYHEVSHAILTPTRLPACDYMNIMEDERIESVLRNYSHDVDFKQQLFDLCGDCPPKATNAIQAFFNAVRFGYAPEKILDESNRILQRYKDLHRNTSYSTAYDYYEETSRLYEKIKKMFRTDPEAFQPPMGKSSSSGEMTKMDELKNGSSEGEQGEGEGKGETNGEGSAEMNGGKSAEGGNAKGADDNGSAEAQNRPTSIGDSARGIKTDIKDLKKTFEQAFDANGELSSEYRQQLEDFRKTAETIIGNFNKKNKSGSGVSAYSGVFNPRMVSRPDYRFFERSMSTQGNNQFGTCHLNLFIDCSGSFCSSQKIMNGILRVLTDIESKNRNFSLDVSFINHNYFDCETIRQRAFKATGGNDIPVDMKERFLKRQKPQTCNYNIVLFDGDAFSDNYEPEKEQIRRFSAFDFKQTTLITDDDNERYLGKGFKSTKVIITKNYTDELIKHITKALTVAFGGH